MEFTGIRCPIQCGDCCPKPPGPGETPDFGDYEGECPFIGPKGCDRSRSTRPPLCQTFICDKGMKAIMETADTEGIIQLRKSLIDHGRLEAKGSLYPWEIT